MLPTSRGFGQVTIRPRGSWEQELLDESSNSGEGFLRASPTGRSHGYSLALGAEVGRWGVEAAHRSRDVELEATLHRSGISAGRLFFATLDLTRQSIEVTRHGAAEYWSLTVAQERVDGDLSTRLETWPFLSLWGTLSAQAYRLQGSLDARSTWMRLRRAPAGTTGWSWGAVVGNYDVSMGRSSWFVTSFGFGRSGQEATSAGVAPAVVVGTEVGRALRLGESLLSARGWAGLPVSARGAADADGPSVSHGRQNPGLAGHAGLALTWFW
jgi:hypothetical protein